MAKLNEEEFEKYKQETNVPCIKVYKREVEEDDGRTTFFGTEKHLKDWKLEEADWIAQDLSVCNDSIELFAEFSIDEEGIREFLDEINDEVGHWRSK